MSGKSPTPEPIAIVGLGCRLPGASTVQSFWETLLAGELQSSPVPEDRLLGYREGVVGSGGKTACLIEDVGFFDAEFFGLTPRQAAWMDPQQRLLLESSWHAWQAAGIEAGDLTGSNTGVYVGSATADFRDRMVHSGAVDRYAAVGSVDTYLANRLSYQYDLRGPSITVDTACSAGLSALSLAVSALRAGEIDRALVGASNVCISGWIAGALSHLSVLSASGECRAFSPEADGYVRGEGALCVVLERADDAVVEQRPVWAVIEAAATSHDGRAGGLTKTDADSQAQLMHRAWRHVRGSAPFGVGSPRTPRQLGYLEAHAAGTRADGIEVDGLRAFLADSLVGPDATDKQHSESAFSGPEGRLWVGSVKTLFGHLEGAAGLASLVKAALILHQQAIPHAGTLLAVDMPEAGAGIRVHEHLGTAESSAGALSMPWPRYSEGVSCMAAVSSFGLGGSNAHALLSPPPPEARTLAALPGSTGLPVQEFQRIHCGFSPDLLDLSLRS